MTNEELKNARIKAQEIKYRYITINFIKDLFSGYTISNISGTPIDCGVDVRFTAITHNGNVITYDVEVKERNKSKENIIKYPNSELKKSKYNSMKESHHNKHLIYIQYINSKWAMIYDVDKLNLDERKTEDWLIKKTEYDDNSEYIVVPTYFIPYAEKKLKINVEKYYIDYALYLQAKKEKQLQTQLF